MKKFEQLLNDFDYHLPQKLIADAPAHPRDSAKILIYDRKKKKVNHDFFFNLASYLPKRCVLILNDTKVLPARLKVKKENGNFAEILYLRHDDKFWHVLCSKKLALGEKVIFGNLTLTVKEKKEGEYVLKPDFPVEKTFSLLEKYGTAPLPPYIKNSSLSEQKKKNEYQTVFAKNFGSVAAPTASLHFTKKLLNELRNKQIQIGFVTLHVGLGTFAKISEAQWREKKLHREFYEIPKQTARMIHQAKKEKIPVIAVGTTAARALESSFASGKIRAGKRSTDIFITPGHEWKVVNGLITNFHVPRSSLLMLVASLIGRKKLFEIYQLAIRKRYRFFSFGDGMLIL